MASLLDGYQLFHEGALALAEIERAGIGVDVEYCREKVAWIDVQSSRSERRLGASVLGRAWERRFSGDVKYASNGQLQAVLFADLGVKSFKKTAKGDSDSVDDEALSQVDVDGISHLQRLRSLKKMRDVLVGFLQHQINGRIYSNYSLHTVVSYRGSSSGPNMQNIPHRDEEQMEVCRRALIPSPGNVLLEVDFSGIEVSTSACYHRDPTMIEYLLDLSSDMHADQAYELFKLAPVLRRHRIQRPVQAKRKVEGREVLPGFGVLRQGSKNQFVFPQFYGDYYESCARGLALYCKLPVDRSWTDEHGIELDGVPIAAHLRSHDIAGLPDFAEHVKSVEHKFWYERFPVYRKWREDWYARYQRRGSFAMKTGFVCSGAMVRNAAVNYPVQGAAFHILLKTLTLVVQRMRGWVSQTVGEIHDSTLVDARPDEVCKIVELIRYIASEELPKIWPWIIVPLRVEASVSETREAGGSWAQMKVVEE